MDDEEETMVKNVLYISDFIARLKVKHLVSNATRLRRDKIYSKVKRAQKGGKKYTEEDKDD
jgi:hypothetical protein